MDGIFRDFVRTRGNVHTYYAANPPCVLVPRRLRQLARHYTNLETEFAWIATVEEVARRQFLLTDFIPTPQQGSEVHVTLLKSGIEELLMRWGDEGAAGEEKINSARCWCQSHHGFGVTPSMVDDGTFERFRSQKLPWFIQAIFNRHSEVNFKLFLEGGDIIVENALWFPIDEEDPDLAALAAAQISDNLTVVPRLDKDETKGGCE